MPSDKSSISKSSHVPEDEERKKSAVTRFYAIRHCDSLRSPAIFTSWSDCHFYLDINESDDTLMYQSFDNIFQAIEYIMQISVTLKVPSSQGGTEQKKEERDERIRLTDAASPSVTRPTTPTTKMKDFGKRPPNDETHPSNKRARIEPSALGDDAATPRKANYSRNPSLTAPSGKGAGGGKEDQDCYEVSFSTKKLGIELEKRKGRFLVKKLQNTELQSRITVGDSIIRIQGKETKGKSLTQFAREISCARRPVSIQFRRSHVQAMPQDNLLESVGTERPEAGPTKKKPLVIRTKPDEDWNKMFLLLQRYKVREGHCCVPKLHVEDGKKLGEWVSVQIMKEKEALLATAKLKLLRSVGLILNEPAEPDVVDEDWHKMFLLLQRYKVREGHCCVPKLHVEDGYKLGEWVSVQIIRKKAALLATAELKLLRSVGPILNEREPAELDVRGYDVVERLVAQLGRRGGVENWMKKLLLLLRHKVQTGTFHLPRRRAIGGKNIGRWREYQRNAYKAGKLAPQKVEILKEVGFDFEAFP